MGGGLVGAELAGAVSAAGALGTIGILPPSLFQSELAGAQDLAEGRPVAANLLVPFVRPGHLRACVERRVPLVVFHGGSGHRWFAELQAEGILAFGTVGNLEQALNALAAGADGLVVQGGEAGGHLVGDQPVATLLPRVRELGEFPILAAGGVADVDDVRALLDAGANAAVSGTRFLLTHESRAHPEYKQRVQAATRTIRTMLFGVGWPLEHRVVPNDATDRWAGPDGEIRGWLRSVQRLSAPLARRFPIRTADRLTSFQRAGRPLFGPGAPLVGMPATAVDRAALYAGESARRIDDIVSAREAVARLTNGLDAGLAREPG